MTWKDYMTADDARLLYDAMQEAMLTIRIACESRHKGGLLPMDAPEAELNGHAQESPLTGGGPTYSGSFELFWKAYPRKVGKMAAWKKWRALKPKLTVVLSALGTQKQSEQWQRDGGQYIPHPETWLNKGRWEDEEMADTTHQNGDGPQDSVGPCPDWRERAQRLRNRRYTLTWATHAKTDVHLERDLIADLEGKV